MLFRSDKSIEMLELLGTAGYLHKAAINLQSPALLVLDMQNYFLLPQSHAYVPSSEAIIPNIQALISTFKLLGLPVIFTRHSNTADNAGAMAIRWKHLTPSDGDMHQISDSFDTNDCKVIDKTQYDAFYRTDLDEYLRKKGIKSLVVVGLIANLCVETSARSAFVHGYVPIVPIDSTASYNEDLLVASMKNICFALSQTTTTKKILEKLS